MLYNKDIKIHLKPLYATTLIVFFFQELCQYQGSIRDVPGSWAAVSTCHGLKGVIFDGENLHHIQPEEESLKASHFIYKHTDLIANNTCG